MFRPHVVNHLFNLPVNTLSLSSSMQSICALACIWTHETCSILAPMLSASKAREKEYIVGTPANARTNCRKTTQKPGLLPSFTCRTPQESRWKPYREIASGVTGDYVILRL